MTALADIDRLMKIDFRTKYPQPFLALLMFLIPAAAFWWIYVPVHEFFHVFGCWGGGGTVTQLDIDHLYGGALFARWIPFVSAGSEYAGRLSGFNPGSDSCYLLTDFGPFVLSLLFGVPLLRLALKRESIALAGPGLILAFAPVLNLLGDYYEMGSIIATRIVFAVLPGAGQWASMEMLRSDDFIKLIRELGTNPAVADPGWPAAVITILLGAILAILLAGFTYQASHWLARLIIKDAPPHTVDPAA